MFIKSIQVLIFFYGYHRSLFANSLLPNQQKGDSKYMLLSSSLEWRIQHAIDCKHSKFVTQFDLVICFSYSSIRREHMKHKILPSSLTFQFTDFNVSKGSFARYDKKFKISFSLNIFKHQLINSHEKNHNGWRIFWIWYFWSDEPHRRDTTSGGSK